MGVMCLQWGCGCVVLAKLSRMTYQRGMGRLGNSSCTNHLINSSVCINPLMTHDQTLGLVQQGGILTLSLVEHFSPQHLTL